MQLDEWADEIMNGDQGDKKKKRKRKNKNKKNRKGGQNEENDMNEDLDGGDQQDNQQQSTELHGESAKSTQNAVQQDSPSKSVKDSNDFSQGQETDNYAGFGYADMTCLAKLSDEEIENQLQLFQGRLSRIFDTTAQKS